MTAQDHDLDAIAAQLHKLFREIDEARKAAENAPPPESTIIPLPESSPMWPHPDSGKMHYPCTSPGDCSWR